MLIFILYLLVAYILIGICCNFVVALYEGYWDEEDVITNITSWPVLLVYLIFYISYFATKKLFEFIESKRKK